MDSETFEDSIEKKILELDLFYLRPSIQEQESTEKDQTKQEDVLIELGKSAIMQKFSRLEDGLDPKQSSVQEVEKLTLEATSRQQ